MPRSVSSGDRLSAGINRHGVGRGGDVVSLFDLCCHWYRLSIAQTCQTATASFRIHEQVERADNVPKTVTKDAWWFLKS